MNKLNNRKIKVGFLMLLALLLISNLFVLQTYAQEEPRDLSKYKLLTPLPEVTDCENDALNRSDCETSLEDYLPGIFKLAVGLATVAAVLMLVFGGFQYISSDAIQGKSEGKERIKNALYALVLIIGSWVILYTINPNLLRINLNIETINTSGVDGGTLGTVSEPGTSMTRDQLTADTAVRESLAAEGITAYRGPCSSGQTTNCVNLNGLAGTTKDGLTVLKNNCTNCTIQITGGTEGGHSATGGHGTGNSVDLSPNTELNTSLGKPSPREGDVVTRVYRIDGKPSITATYTYETLGGNAAGTSSGNHWHVNFR